MSKINLHINACLVIGGPLKSISTYKETSQYSIYILLKDESGLFYGNSNRGIDFTRRIISRVVNKNINVYNYL